MASATGTDSPFLKAIAHRVYKLTRSSMPAIRNGVVAWLAEFHKQMDERSKWLATAPDATEIDDDLNAYGPKEPRRLYPLPFPDGREPSINEKIAALAAIYDVIEKGEKVCPIDADREWVPFWALRSQIDFLTPADSNRLMLWCDESEKHVAGWCPAGSPAMARATWQEVAHKLERLREQGEPCMTRDKHAALFSCSVATVDRAIAKTPSLHQWAGYKRPAIPKAQTLTDVVTDSVPQCRESGPSNLIEEADIDRTMRQLMEQAAPEHRAALNKMSDEERRRVAAFAIENHDVILDDDDRGNRILGRRP